MRVVPLIVIAVVMTMAVSLATVFNAADLNRVCPTADGLAAGIVVSDPARVGTLFLRYRKLDERLVARSYINGAFTRSMTISYSGLFTYAHWNNGVWLQYERPLNDISSLLDYEVGTTQKVETIRFNPSAPERWFRVSTTYAVDSEDQLDLDEGKYRSVRILRYGTSTSWDGVKRRIHEHFVIVPELMLRTSGPANNYGDVSGVRERRPSDAEVWPFTKDFKEVVAEANEDVDLPDASRL